MAKLKVHYTGDVFAHQRSLCKQPKVGPNNHTKDWDKVDCVACLKMQDQEK